MVTDRHGRRVPWVTLWSAEPMVDPVAQVGPSGLTDPPAGDLDAHWTPTRQLQGGGEPIFGKTHPARQSFSLQERVCGVCARRMRGTPTFLLSGQDAPHLLAGGEAFITPTPPTCPGCVLFSLRECPHLGALAGQWFIECDDPTPVGVFGPTFTPHVGFGEAGVVGFHDPRFPFTVAQQLVVVLRDWRRLTLPLVGGVAPTVNGSRSDDASFVD